MSQPIEPHPTDKPSMRNGVNLLAIARETVAKFSYPSCPYSASSGENVEFYQHRDFCHEANYQLLKKALVVASQRAEPQAVPDGWQLVPIEPTKEMLIAGETAIENNIDQTADSHEAYEVYDEMTLATRSYEAMLASAPKPPEDRG